MCRVVEGFSMGFFDVFSSKQDSRPGMDLDKAMESLEDESIDVLHEPADFYVKPLSLETDSDIAVVEGELKGRNVVLLNIAAYMRNPQKLKESLGRLTSIAASIDGDIARISEDKVILTPGRMKIVKHARK